MKYPEENWVDIICGMEIIRRPLYGGWEGDADVAYTFLGTGH